MFGNVGSFVLGFNQHGCKIRQSTHSRLCNMSTLLAMSGEQVLQICVFVEYNKEIVYSYVIVTNPAIPDHLIDKISVSIRLAIYSSYTRWKYKINKIVFFFN